MILQLRSYRVNNCQKLRTNISNKVNTYIKSSNQSNSLVINSLRLYVESIISLNYYIFFLLTDPVHWSEFNSQLQGTIINEQHEDIYRIFKSISYKRNIWVIKYSSGSVWKTAVWLFLFHVCGVWWKTVLWSRNTRAFPADIYLYVYLPISVFVCLAPW